MSDDEKPGQQAKPLGVDTSEIRPHDPAWRLANKYRMKRFAGRKITLPTGIPVEAARFAHVRPPGADHTNVISTPERMLKSPKPHCRYVWRIRADEETIGLAETGAIRPVRMDEIVRDRHTARVIPWTGPQAIKYVGWKRLALFEVDPQTSYEWFRQPEEYALSQLANLGGAFEAKVEEQSRGQASGEFYAKDRQSAAREKMTGGPGPRRN